MEIEFYWKFKLVEIRLWERGKSFLNFLVFEEIWRDYTSMKVVN